MLQGETSKRTTLFIFLAFSLFHVYRTFDISYTYDRQDKVINEDAFGYYLILPALFHYNDPEFEFLDSSLKSDESFKSYIPPVVNIVDQSEKVCKYYSGVAFLQAPFYFIARLSASDNSNPFDSHHQFWILVSVIVYVIIASYLIFDRLLIWGFSPFVSIAMLAFTLHGTNLLTYITYDPAYSHSYSFFAITLFIEMLLRIKESKRLSHIILGCLAYGLTISIRPLNGIIIFLIPIILGNVKPYLPTLFKSRNLFFTLTSVALFPMLQSVIWYWQTSQFYVYPYAGEKLDILSPQILEFLFGFNVGWAIYTPSAFLLLLSGLTILFIKRHYRLAICTAIFGFVLIYLLSSWHYLHYGCTSGCRPITEFYGSFTLLFAYSLIGLKVKPILKYCLISIMSLSFFYNWIVQYQFFNHIINWCDMDKARYKMVFLKTHEVYRYSTYSFWDFNEYKERKPFLTIDPKISLCQSDEKKSEDHLEINGIDGKDSSILVTMKLIGTRSNDNAYLRLLITEDGKYIEQQTLLLSRKISKENEKQEFEFEFPIRKKIKNLKIRVGLESTFGAIKANLVLRNIELRRMETLH